MIIYSPLKLIRLVVMRLQEIVLGIRFGLTVDNKDVDPSLLQAAQSCQVDRREDPTEPK